MFDLHDYIFEQMHYFHQSKKLIFTARSSEERITIEALSIRDLSLQITEPWGPSIHVNECDVNEQKVKVELQSGDILSFRYETISARREKITFEEKVKNSNTLY
jgi:hypothetical protein